MAEGVVVGNSIINNDVHVFIIMILVPRNSGRVPLPLN